MKEKISTISLLVGFCGSLVVIYFGNHVDNYVPVMLLGFPFAGWLLSFFIVFSLWGGLSSNISISPEKGALVNLLLLCFNFVLLYKLKSFIAESNSWSAYLWIKWINCFIVFLLLADSALRLRESFRKMAKGFLRLFFGLSGLILLCFGIALLYATLQTFSDPDFFGSGYEFFTSIIFSLLALIAGAVLFAIGTSKGDDELIIF